ncbi:hypothetical protein H6P81_010591 [Aristolochia fimbriata]|uniref:Translation initiation factor eIF2B subunit delta n=1 Tax=Aristolochia fimbriata TaxID=158543 RepID=A0AAV7ES13_ARIFI|nr:hypothetical protein H6P81_010591 [Aristolochia fimbriata]
MDNQSSSSSLKLCSHKNANRPSRAVSDPKVRQVGFITPNEPPPEPTQSSATGSSPPVSVHNSPVGTLSPVMIPPLAHAYENLSASLRLLSGHPFPVPSTQRPITETSPMRVSPSSKNGWDGEFSRDLTSPRRARGNPSGAVDIGAAMMGRTNINTAVVNMPPRLSVSEKNRAVIVSHELSKPLKERTSKAERRDLQEHQRARKAAALKEESGESNRCASAAGKPSPSKKEGASGSSVAASDKKVAYRSLGSRDRKKVLPHDMQRVEKSKRDIAVHEQIKGVEFFGHFPQDVQRKKLALLESKFFQHDQMHPAVFKVGLLFLAGDISGGNSRCIAMLQAFRDAIKDYSTPPEKDLFPDLTDKIGSYVSSLKECRPLSVVMENAIKFLKKRIGKLHWTTMQKTRLGFSLTDSEATATLQSDIDYFINQRIILADKGPQFSEKNGTLFSEKKGIVDYAVTKIEDKDVLLTYGSSSVVEMIFVYAQKLGKKFQVVVVDSHPMLEGQSLLRRLVAKGIACTYTHINAVSHVMCEAKKVFLGASPVLSNGTVYSRIGTACVAMVAHELRKPVLICCEAYKFHERARLDSICCNELGDPDAILKVRGRRDSDHLSNWADLENVQLLNLLYDTTPSEYVTAIVSDYGIVPPTSAPLILRLYKDEVDR